MFKGATSLINAKDFIGRCRIDIDELADVRLPRCAVLCCAALRWAALRWAGLGWAGLGWAGLGWAGLGWGACAYLQPAAPL